MRVLHVIPSLSAVHGGPSRALELMEGALASLGAVVETATTDDNGPGRRNGKDCGVTISENGIVRRYFHKRGDFYTVSPGFARWVLRHVQEYDLLHVHALFSFTSVAAAWAARRAGVPYVIRPLGVLTRYGVTQRRPWLKRLSLRFVEGPILRDAAAVHFTSDAERDEALLLGIPLRSTVIPLGVEPAMPGRDPGRLLAQIPAAREAFRLVFLSRLDPKKNFEGLIRALVVLQAQGHRPALLVGGGGQTDYVARLHDLARMQGVAGQIHWLGQVSGDTKADLLAAGDLFVLPSYSENFGIAVAEALAAGLPCVIGHGVALSDAVQAAGAGVAVDPDADAIAAGLARYLNAPELLVAAGKAAFQLAAREYSVQVMGTRLMDLYTSILSSTRRE